MFCSVCGGKISDSVDFCNYCGSRVQRTPEPVAENGWGRISPLEPKAENQGEAAVVNTRVAASAFNVQATMSPYTPEIKPSAQPVYQMPHQEKPKEITTYVPVSYPVQQTRNDTILPPAFEIKKHRKKASIIPLLLTGALAAAAAVLFWLFGASPVGWGIAGAVTAGLFILQLTAAKRKTALRWILWGISIAAVGCVFVLTAPVLVQRQIDLGNVMNGQIVCDDGNYLYYSVYNSNLESHIIRKEKSTGNTVEIFDGVGRGIIQNGEWLYFVGYPNDATNTDRTLWRMKKDGSDAKKLNSVNSLKPIVYEQWIYYIEMGDDQYTFLRCKLDGSGVETVAEGVSPYCLIYRGQVYYANYGGAIFRADVDGGNAVRIGSDRAMTLFIKGGKMYYSDPLNNVRVCNLDGSDAQTIIRTNSKDIYCIQTDGDRLLYLETGFLEDKNTGAYDYSIHSVRLDGSDNKELCSGKTHLFYINILSGRIYYYETVGNNRSNYEVVLQSMDVGGGSPNEMKG